MCFSDSCLMGILETILLLILGVVVLSSLSAGAIFSTDLLDKHFQKKTAQLGEDICWDLMHPHVYNFGIIFECYGVVKPKKSMSELKTVKYIKKQLLMFLEAQESDILLKTLSYNMIVMNQNKFGMHPKNAYINQIFNLEQILIFSEQGFNPEHVASLKDEGFSFEQILNLEGIPASWATKVYN